MTFLYSVSLYTLPQLAADLKQLRGRRVTAGGALDKSLSGSKWDKQFYLELAQLLAQQLSTLIFRFLDKGKVEFGNLLSPLLSHSCSADRRWWRSLVESGEGEGETAGAP